MGWIRDFAERAVNEGHTSSKIKEKADLNAKGAFLFGAITAVVGWLWGWWAIVPGLLALHSTLTAMQCSLVAFEMEKIKNNEQN